MREWGEMAPAALRICPDPDMEVLLSLQAECSRPGLSFPHQPPWVGTVGRALWTVPMPASFVLLRPAAAQVTALCDSAWLAEATTPCWATRSVGRHWRCCREALCMAAAAGAE